MRISNLVSGDSGLRLPPVTKPAVFAIESLPVSPSVFELRTPPLPGQMHPSFPQRMGAHPAVCQTQDDLPRGFKTLRLSRIVGRTHHQLGCHVARRANLGSGAAWLLRGWVKEARQPQCRWCRAFWIPSPPYVQAGALCICRSLTAHTAGKHEIARQIKTARMLNAWSFARPKSARRAWRKAPSMRMLLPRARSARLARHGGCVTFTGMVPVS